MKVTYAITVCNELHELKRLIEVLNTYSTCDTDEIVILYDSTVEDNGGVAQYLHNHEYVSTLPVTVVEGVLRNPTTQVPNFADFKNQIFKVATGDYIFQVDADEIPSEALVSNIHDIIKLNRQYDVILVPRVNTVDGITEKYVRQWGWRVYKLPNYMAKTMRSDLSVGAYNLLSEFQMIQSETDGVVHHYQPIINYPDYQFRLYANSINIRWDGMVHERLIGYAKLGHIPQHQQDYHIYHPKNLQRQIMQNALYETIR